MFTNAAQLKLKKKKKKSSPNKSIHCDLSACRCHTVSLLQ